MTLKGLTLTGGDPNDDSSGGNGGAIFSQSRLKVIDCTIEINFAYSGGGIHINVADDSSTTPRQVLTIEDSVIRNNRAGAGGGIDIDSGGTNDPTSDVFSITRTTISDNHALSQFDDFGGGGIYAELHGAHLTVTESTISGNTTAATSGNIDDPGGGGGLYVQLRDSAALTVEKTTVSGNQATFGDGGGILAKAYDSAPYPDPRAITITRSTISENKAGSRGGGLFLFNREGTEVLVQESRVTGNEVTSAANYLNGGGIYAFLWNGHDEDPDVDADLKPKWTITGSTVDDNIAPEKGGGIFVRSKYNGDFIATNSTISGNETTESSGAGGGMYINHDPGSHSVDAYLRNLTITQNVSADGGGVETRDLNEVRVRIANSIISENFDHNDDPNNLDGRVIDGDFKHNLVGTGSTILNAAGTTPTLDSTNLTGNNTPLLGDLQDNGGPTPTHALIYDPQNSMISPAIDAGSNALAEDPLTNVDFATDQRGAGFPRSFNYPTIADSAAGPVDMGAFELNQLCVSTTTDEFDTDLSYNDLSLREAVDYANDAGVPTAICVPAGDYVLELSGTESTTNSNTDVYDLDILGNVTIIGAGPGLTVIDAEDLTNHGRIFDIVNAGVLHLSGVTLQMGDTPSGGQANGGAIRVQNGGRLELDYSAIAGNDTGSSGTGGAIYFAPTATGSIETSVITLNTADEQTGGVYLEAGSGIVTIKSTIVANNNVGETDPDIYAGSSGRLQSLGYNRFTSYAGFTLHDTDHVGSVDYVVTSIVDKYDTNYDTKKLSLREGLVWPTRPAARRQSGCPPGHSD